MFFSSSSVNFPISSLFLTDSCQSILPSDSIIIALKLPKTGWGAFAIPRTLPEIDACIGAETNSSEEKMLFSNHSSP